MIEISMDQIFRVIYDLMFIDAILYDYINFYSIINKIMNLNLLKKPALYTFKLRKNDGQPNDDIAIFAASFLKARAKEYN